jgi:NADH-quinone oxidoreductase subunit L
LLASFAIVGSVLTGVYVARALRLLWGDDGVEAETPISGMGWMIAPLGLLAGLAVVLGAVAEPLYELLDTDISESLSGVIAGLAAAVLGLSIGWLRRETFLPAQFRVLADHGFRINGGFVDLVARPALAVGRFGDRVDHRIHAAVLAVGQGARGVARIGNVLDAGIHRGVEAVGTFSLVTADVTRIFDESGIDGFIRDLVRTTRAMGIRARQLQTGFVHQEMLAAAVATILVVVLLFI